MRTTFHQLLTLFLLISTNHTCANDNPLAFQDQHLERRYHSMIEEIRCLVCQNQSLADSNADLAQDLRNEIYQMIIAGDNDKKIIKFLVDRYGDFVLYHPPLQRNTWLLWFGPFIFLLTGLVIAIIIIKKQSNENAKKISKAEQLRLSEIFSNDSNEEKL